MHIEEFCLFYNLGKVIKITKLTGGLMHKMFKVKTDTNTYAIKVLNPEVMRRGEALDNFILSETISNLAKKENIPVSSAIKLNDTFISKFKDTYYMVFDYVEGTTLKDEDITIEHCKKIGNILSSIHKLDYQSIGLTPNIKEDNFFVEWSNFISHENFNKMTYKDLYLNNYHKYYSILKRSIERFNESNNIQTICHRDMDPKNVMWIGNEPIIIDWESASLSNPYRELIEDALCWSGFLSDNFNKDKFSAVISEYLKDNTIDTDIYSVICGNLIGRFGWLDYNLKRSLGIKSNDEEEMLIAENEVSKTINEINRYLELIGPMYDIVTSLIEKQESIDNLIESIINHNDILKNLQYTKINAGFTNTIYKVEEYIVRICTDENNEERFINEINFYKENQNEYIPKLYFSDITKTIIPYYYEVIECIEGPTLYDIWYKIDSKERENIIKEIVKFLKSIHAKKVEEYDFASFIKNKLTNLLSETNIENKDFNELITKCDIYFKDNKFGLIHNDLHFDNFIYNEGNLKLIDFERCMSAPIDYDLKIFNHYNKTPWKWASFSTDMITIEDDYKDFMDLIISNYEELNDIPYLKERLTIYKIIDYLNDYKRTSDNSLLEEILFLVSQTIK